jgi:hypothetical protein
VIARSAIAGVLSTFLTCLVLVVATGARADSTPVGALPRGPVSTVTTSPNQLIAVALPDAGRRSRLVWRIARPYDASVLHQISEATIGQRVVLVFRVVGRGDTALVFALTQGDTSGKAIKALTHKVHSR